MLMYSLLAFYKADPSIYIIVVINKNLTEQWQELCIQYGIDIAHQVVEGGPERFHSVKNGLSQISHEGLVAVHDGARPMVSPALISNAFNKAEKYKAVVPVSEISESVRIINGALSRPTDRRKLKLVQTPQVFLCSLLKKAYLQQYDPIFTDDATVAEADGNQITLIEGSTRNIKITKPDDLIIAEALLASNDQIL